MISLKNKIKNLPKTSGIYLFYNFKKELIYVGKATDLKSRVGSYFRGVRTSRPIEQMIEEVKDIKVIETESVLEAIILEGKYIKTKQPKYNVDWKDDKSWNYIYITNDKYPKVLTIREHDLHAPNPSQEGNSLLEEGREVFGPYPGLKVKEMMRLLQKLFNISICRPADKQTKQAKNRPCFYYELGQCLGVCVGEISPADYKKKVITPLKQFLKGNKKTLLKNLTKKMKEASKDKKFEEAGRLRDQIKHLQKIQDIALLNKSFLNTPPTLLERREHTPDPSQEGNSLLEEGREVLRIEGYDISNLGSTDKVGSLVVFENGEPKKSDYRKFNIKGVLGQSDVDCLAEVVERRLNHPEWPLPDIFLIDGGVPQVNRVKQILSTNKLLNQLTNKPVVGIAKGPKRDKNEFIFDGRNKNMVKFVKQNKNTLIQVRDEAHRFAIQFNRSKRKVLRK